MKKRPRADTAICNRQDKRKLYLLKENDTITKETIK